MQRLIFIFIFMFLACINLVAPSDSDAVTEEKLLASDITAEARFGTAVAAFGNTVVVKATHARNNGTVSGAAYVFRYTGSRWVQEAKLTDSDGVDDRFTWGSFAPIQVNLTECLLSGLAETQLIFPVNVFGDLRLYRSPTSSAVFSPFSGGTGCL